MSSIGESEEEVEAVVIDQSEPERVEDEPTTAEPPSKPLEERIKGLENRLKLVAIVVSVLALAAPIASATAAWFSWQTAKSSLEVAQANLDTSGANIVISDDVSLVGYCDDPPSPTYAVINIYNKGRTAGRLYDIQVSLAEPRKLKAYPERVPYSTTMASHKDSITIGPQDGLRLEMPVGCDYLKEHKIASADSSQLTGNLWMLMRNNGVTVRIVAWSGTGEIIRVDMRSPLGVKGK